MSKADEESWKTNQKMVLERLERNEQDIKDLKAETQATADKLQGHDINFALVSYGVTTIPVIVLAVLAYLKFHNKLKGATSGE